MTLQDRGAHGSHARSIVLVQATSEAEYNISIPGRPLETLQRAPLWSHRRCRPQPSPASMRRLPAASPGAPPAAALRFSLHNTPACTHKPTRAHHGMTPRKHTSAHVRSGYARSSLAAFISALTPILSDAHALIAQQGTYPILSLCRNLPLETRPKPEPNLTPHSRDCSPLCQIP